MDRVDDLENRSRRANLRILNVPENSEKGQSTVKFVSEMLMEVMCQEVFEKPPELERAHRSLGPKPQEGRPPRPLVICFYRFQEKEKALRWARQNEARYKDSTLRIYPDISADLARKRAAFKKSNSCCIRRMCDSSCFIQHGYEFVMKMRLSFSICLRKLNGFMISGLLQVNNFGYHGNDIVKKRLLGRPKTL